MLEVQKLTKRYGDFTAVDDISFDVRPGEVLGFLGPNGAGKSTTMKVIAGYLAPTEGSVRVMGHSVEDDALAAKQVIGYLPEGAPGYGEMSPAAFLDFIASIRGLRGSERGERMREVIARLHLDKVLHQNIDTLSKGFRRRVGLAQAILHDPQVLILDEPTDGLDPNQKHEVRELIAGMASDKIVVISTHILEEVEAVCDRAIIIASGRVVADATPAELASRSRYYQAVRLRVDEAERVSTLLSSLQSVASVERDASGRLIVIPRDSKNLQQAVRDRLAEESIEAREFSIEGGRLDDVFRAITTDSDRVKTA